MTTKKEMKERTDFEDRYNRMSKQNGTRKLDRNYIAAKKLSFNKNKAKRPVEQDWDSELYDDMIEELL